MRSRTARLLAAILALVTTMAIAQEEASIMELGEIDSVYSNILKESREIWVHVPEQDDTTRFASEKFPVLFLLDGADHFHTIAAMTRQLSSVNGGKFFPKLIVVGIRNTNRTRDFTPCDDEFFKNVYHQTCGGAEQFTEFIEKELIPHLEGNYPAAPHRILAGHSFGGLFAIHTLSNHPKLFDNYLAIDPSLWWAGEKMVPSYIKALQANKLQGKTLYTSLAASYRPEKDTAKIRLDTTGKSLAMRSIMWYDDELKRNYGNGLRSKMKYYPEDNHYSVPIISIYDGLRYMYDYYPMKENLFDTTIDVAAVISAHYAMISNQMGYELRLPQPYLMGEAARKAKNGKLAEGIALLELVVATDPQRGMAWQALGDLYSEANEKEKAKAAYKKALESGSEASAQEKLNKLEE